jgi:hypothetical protein
VRAGTARVVPAPATAHRAACPSLRGGRTRVRAVTRNENKRKTHTPWPRAVARVSRRFTFSHSLNMIAGETQLQSVQYARVPFPYVRVAGRHSQVAAQSAITGIRAARSLATRACQTTSLWVGWVRQRPQCTFSARASSARTSRLPPQSQAVRRGEVESASTRPR